MSKGEPTIPAQHELDPRAQFELDKIAFARLALAEAHKFMVLDNEVVKSLAQITAALAKYAEAHPDRVFSDSRTGGLGTDVKPGDLAGGDFLSDIVGLIKDILVADKQFILDLIKKLVGL